MSRRSRLVKNRRLRLPSFAAPDLQDQSQDRCFEVRDPGGAGANGMLQLAVLQL